MPSAPCDGGASRPFSSSTGVGQPPSSCAATAVRASAVRTASSRSSTTSTEARCGAITAAGPRRHRRSCPACGSSRIRYFGAGTQRVEAELRARFPGLRIGRLDSDALAARRGFETIYDDFREGRTDVLVGTQLAAKGLDLPSVTLAAVVAADVTLNLPDYRAAERTFQLLAQVAGRAGRGPMPGRVIVQTYAPGHYAVRTAAALDVDAFADEELLRRRLLGYPPFSVLARLLVADADRSRAEERGRQAAAAVTLPGVEVLGPLPSYVARRAGRFRMQVVIRAPDASTRAAALERDPGRGRDRRRSRVAPLNRYNRPAMAIRRILTAEEPILRERAKRVSSFDASLHRLLEDMLETMRDAPGVGLAANQIGVPLQVAVIEIDDAITELVNPQIVKGSGEQLDWEGCLSIPGYVAEVTRYEKVTVKARDRHGREFRVKGDELFSRALQHEIDHLNGALYIDSSTRSTSWSASPSHTRRSPKRRPPGSSGGHRSHQLPRHRAVRGSAARPRRGARRRPRSS